MISQSERARRAHRLESIGKGLYWSSAVLWAAAGLMVPITIFRVDALPFTGPALSFFVSYAIAASFVRRRALQLAAELRREAG